MSAPEFPQRSLIVASTSDLFPAESRIHVKEIQTNRVEIRLELTGSVPETLFQADLGPSAPEADLRIEGEFVKKERIFKAVLTLCPGTDRKFLLGEIRLKNGYESGGTGVWVAEEQQPPKPPGNGC